MEEEEASHREWGLRTDGTLAANQTSRDFVQIAFIQHYLWLSSVVMLCTMHV